jgi:hypothetical protein
MHNKPTRGMLVVYFIQISIWFVMAYCMNLEAVMGSFAEMSDFYGIFDHTIGVPKFWFYTIFATSVLWLCSVWIKV